MMVVLKRCEEKNYKAGKGGRGGGQGGMSQSVVLNLSFGKSFIERRHLSKDQVIGVKLGVSGSKEFQSEGSANTKT